MLNGSAHAACACLSQMSTSALATPESCWPPTLGETGWLDEREEHAWRALKVMHDRLTAALSRELAADSPLSYLDYEVLVARTDGRVRGPAAPVPARGAPRMGTEPRIPPHCSNDQPRPRQ